MEERQGGEGESAGDARQRGPVGERGWGCNCSPSDEAENLLSMEQQERLFFFLFSLSAVLKIPPPLL